MPFFHLEDVYVALCIKKLGYHLKDYPGFNPERIKLDLCVYNGETLVTAHFIRPNTTRQMWMTKCVQPPSYSISTQLRMKLKRLVNIGLQLMESPNS